MTAPPPETLPGWGDESLSDAAYAAIVDQLRTHRQFAPEAYQERCLRRRIARRIHSSGAGDSAAYLARLSGDDAELDALLAALSLHVSQFFRNPGTFRILEAQILPDLCQRARANGRDELQLWSVGCAGGEEAYSLALLVDELAPPGLAVSILATDVSTSALAIARAGRYDPARLTAVPATVLARYFSREDGGYQLCRALRERVTFARHDLLTATPFPAADLILCRNVLIYFNRAEQTRVIARFAAARRAGGVLVLGSTETLPANPGLSLAELPGERIYRRTAVAVDR
jgi:chemotaxis protein methyltransferase CheR